MITPLIRPLLASLQSIVCHSSFVKIAITLVFYPTSQLFTSATVSAQAVNDSQLPTVVSINLCADQMVLLLAAPAQILSLSNLSHQQAGSYYFNQAQQYPANEGHAEQVLGLQPDLVIAGQYSSKYTVDLLREVGLRVETLPIASDIATMLDNIGKVAYWLKRETTGDSIVKSLDKRLSALDTDVTDKPVVAVYDPNGYTSGVHSLRGQMMELSGWRNAAAIAGIQHNGYLSLESIIRIKPDALIDSPYSTGTYSRAQAKSQHPALHKAGVNPHIIHVPSRKTVCAGPWTVDVIEQLQSERLRLFGSH